MDNARLLKLVVASLQLLFIPGCLALETRVTSSRVDCAAYSDYHCAALCPQKCSTKTKTLYIEVSARLSCTDFSALMIAAGFSRAELVSLAVATPLF